MIIEKLQVRKSPWAVHEKAPWIVVASGEGLIEDSATAGFRRGFYATKCEAIRASNQLQSEIGAEA